MTRETKANYEFKRHGQ